MKSFNRAFLEFWANERFGDHEFQIRRKSSLLNKTIYIKYSENEDDSYIEHDSIPLTSCMCPNIPQPFKIRKNEFKLRDIGDMFEDD